MEPNAQKKQKKKLAIVHSFQCKFFLSFFCGSFFFTSSILKTLQVCDKEVCPVAFILFQIRHTPWQTLNRGPHPSHWGGIDITLEGN